MERLGAARDPCARPDGPENQHDGHDMPLRCRPAVRRHEGRGLNYEAENGQPKGASIPFCDEMFG